LRYSHRWREIDLNACRTAVIAAVLLLVVFKKTVFDNKKMAQDIEQQSSKQGTALKNVSCPKNEEVKKGKTFTCTATLTNGQKFNITFQMTDNNGTVKFVKATKQ